MVASNIFINYIYADQFLRTLGLAARIIIDWKNRLPLGNVILLPKEADRKKF
jgi:hypothetical protein